MKNFKPDKHLQAIGRWPRRALPYPSRFPAWREVSGTASRAPGHPGEIRPFWIAYTAWTASKGAIWRSRAFQADLNGLQPF